MTLVTTLAAVASLSCVALVPQRPSVGSVALPGVVVALGLDRVVTTWWFRVLVTLATAQLASVVAYVAPRDARRVVRSRGPASHDPFVVDDEQALVRVLRHQGYRPVGRGEPKRRYLKNGLGYLGPTLLHTGMLLAMLGVLVVTLTRSVGLVTMVEGQTLPQGAVLEDAVRGPLGAPAVLPYTLTLAGMYAEFWDNGEPKTYVGTYVVDDGLHAERVDVQTNHPAVLQRMRLHQEQRIGYAFFVTLEGSPTPQRLRLDLPQPLSPEQATYKDRVLESGETIRAKCTVDERRREPPVLTLRLARGGQTVGEARFERSAREELGTYTATVDGIRRWSIVTVEQSRGYGLLFSSFFVVFVGAVALYALVPREITLSRSSDGRMVASWYAPRFASLYSHERESLRAAAQGERS
ncbi:MAG: cytochrome c biogenesis protein ResB [Coriobacteriales bacterium]